MERFCSGGSRDCSFLLLGLVLICCISMCFQKFIDLGCEAKVKEMYSVEQGQVYTGWATVIITTPAHMWEISQSLGEQIFLEQLYESVDIRFDKVVWPET